jgi:hypothetical protein
LGVTESQGGKEYPTYSEKKVVADWSGHILCRNCFLQHFIEGKIEGRIKVMGRRGRRRKKLLYDLKGKRGCCKLREEAPDRTMCKNRVARGCGPVVRQTAECTNEYQVMLMLLLLCHRAIYGSADILKHL